MSLIAPADSDYVLRDFDSKGYDIRRLQAEGIIPFDPDGKQALQEVFAPGYETYHKIVKSSVRRNPDSPALASRKYDFQTKTSAPEYEAITYAEMDEKKRALGSGLLFLLQNNPFKRSGEIEAHAKIDSHVAEYPSYNTDKMSFVVTLFAQNRAEWVLTDIMCASYSLTNTALYDTLGPGTSSYILSLTESPVVIASGIHVKLLINLKKQSPKELASFICLVSMDPLAEVFGAEESKKLVQEAKSVGIMLYDMDQVCEVGRIFPHDELPLNQKPSTRFLSLRHHRVQT
ncbi:hypothetical protein CJJ09_004436 [Candidozyma auris]|nr:hypothetical protein CJJ09_004436 [[Candida] auris]